MKKIILVLCLLVAPAFQKPEFDTPSFVQEKLKGKGANWEEMKKPEFWNEENMKDLTDAEKLEKNTQFLQDSISGILEKYQLVSQSESLEDFLEMWGNMKEKRGYGGDHDFWRGPKEGKGEKMYGGDHDQWKEKRFEGDWEQFKQDKQNLLGGGDHDQQRGRKGKRGGEEDQWKEKKGFLGGGDHDDWRNKRGGDHDNWQDRKPMLGEGDHDNWQDNKPMLGGGDHDNWRQKGERRGGRRGGRLLEDDLEGGEHDFNNKRGGDHDKWRERTNKRGKGEHGNQQMPGSGDHDNWQQPEQQKLGEGDLDEQWKNSHKRGGSHDNHDSGRPKRGGEHDNVGSGRPKRGGDTNHNVVFEKHNKPEKVGADNHDRWRTNNRNRGRNLEEDYEFNFEEKMAEKQQKMLEKIPEHFETALRAVFSKYEEFNNETSVLFQLEEIAKERNDFSIPLPEDFQADLDINDLSEDEESIEATKTILVELLLSEVEKDEGFAEYDEETIVKRQVEITDEAIFKIRELRKAQHERMRERKMKRINERWSN